METPPFFPPGIINTFRIIGSCIAKGLMEVGIRAEMRAEGRATPDEALGSSCFSSPSRYELLSENWTKEGCKSWISGL